MGTTSCKTDIHNHTGCIVVCTILGVYLVFLTWRMRGNTPGGDTTIYYPVSAKDKVFEACCGDGRMNDQANPRKEV